MKSFFFGAILLFGIPAILSAADCPNPGPGSPLGCLYDPVPGFTTTFSGDFSTGIALADLNRDGYPDLVVANGYDAAPQMLKVYHHRGAGAARPFGRYPDWVSDENGHLMDVAVGDVDGDGWLDVAVAVAYGSSRDLATGGVAVYRNLQGRLEPRPSYRTAGGYLPTGCALADLDADGDLDLAVAALLEGSGRFPEALSQAGYGRARVYANQDGALSPSPAWTSAEPLGAVQVVAADLDQDGWMDLAFAAARPSVFRGRRPQPGAGFPLPASPDWTPSERFAFSAGIDAAPPETREETTAVPRAGRSLRLAVSVGCVDLETLLTGQKAREAADCTSRLVVYRPATGNQPVWRSGPLDNASRVRWADLNADGFADLVVDQWGETRLADSAGMGGSLWLFQGSPDHGFSGQPAFRSSQQRIGFGLALADVRQRGTAEKRHVFEAGGPAAVLTLPEPASRVIQVERRQGGASRVLSSREFTTVPGAGWISLARPLVPGETLTVTYQSSPVVDIAVAVGNPQYGNDLYTSRLTTEKGKQPL